MCKTWKSRKQEMKATKHQAKGNTNIAACIRKPQLPRCRKPQLPRCIELCCHFSLLYAAYGYEVGMLTISSHTARRLRNRSKVFTVSLPHDGLLTLLKEQERKRLAKKGEASYSAGRNQLL